MYFLGDAQGSTRALVDGGGLLGQTFDYDAFGNLQDTYTTLDTSYLYTGQQFDPFSELYSLRARYYDPSLGRFLTRDTWPYDYSNPVELNRYVYVSNNPATYYDPSGYTFVGRISLKVIRAPSRAAIVRLGLYVGGGIGTVAVIMLLMQVDIDVEEGVDLSQLGDYVETFNNSGGNNNNDNDPNPIRRLIGLAIGTGILTIPILCALLCPQPEREPRTRTTEQPATHTPQPTNTPEPTPTRERGFIVRHYTNVESYRAIIGTGFMNPSPAELGTRHPGLFFTSPDPWLHWQGLGLGYNRPSITFGVGLPGRDFTEMLEKSACYIDIQKDLLPEVRPTRYWMTRTVSVRLEHIYINTENTPIYVGHAIVGHGSVYSLDPAGNSDEGTVNYMNSFNVDPDETCEAA